jgi:hypothetical protein
MKPQKDEHQKLNNSRACCTLRTELFKPPLHGCLCTGLPQGSPVPPCLCRTVCLTINGPLSLFIRYMLLLPLPPLLLLLLLLLLLCLKRSVCVPCFLICITQKQRAGREKHNAE